MSVTACAGIVERGDPERFRTVMAAPVALREPLFVLYAMNVEVSRAPWVTQEAMIAEMRLQWWRDALEEIAEGHEVRKHEVTTPLAALLAPEDARQLDSLVAARRWDIYRDAFEDQAHYDAYINQTAGHLMWIAAKLTGVGDDAGTRDIAYAAGVANFLRAVPDLAAAGRIPLLDGTHEGLRQLAQRALERLGPKRRAAPAHWPAIGARAVLRQVINQPELVGDGQLGRAITPGRLLWTSLTGRV